jgi:hypothetical protein
LLPYQSPVLNYIDEKNVSIAETVAVTPLLEIDAFYATSKRSLYLDKLKSVFNDYALKNNAQYFVSNLQGSTPQ